jgi:hypothetical protein
MTNDSVTRTLPGGAHPAEVVAAEVDEHQVLGALLRVGQQLERQRVVLASLGPRGRVPAIGRSGHAQAAGRLQVAADQHLGRRADQRGRRQLEAVHVRRRVGRAQHAVQLERVERAGARPRDREQLRQHDLEDVAGAMYSRALWTAARKPSRVQNSAGAAQRRRQRRQVLRAQHGRPVEQPRRPRRCGRTRRRSRRSGRRRSRGTRTRRCGRAG